eukprot:CAMPEP_0179036988 /NCGR_PEP_ID=MMETSP0796-20121207/13898_1 /TAXON_ID=73915 /ORGANISM="Pyrodinium bahamense, Strain pbaha01" /LENGTH=135 /DNA_ID=CAMNT_0020733285 /DNA_START=219 /DNA_END=622 /DNA_ORIENTATION=+
MTLLMASLLALLAPLVRSSEGCSLSDSTCPHPQQHEGETAGLGLLQGRVQRDRASIGSGKEAGSDIKANTQMDECGCTPGHDGWSSRAQRCSSTSQTSPEEAAGCACGCTPGQDGWSSRAQRCSTTSETSPQEAA